VREICVVTQEDVLDPLDVTRRIDAIRAKLAIR